jgi:large subunit ribosomal protein L19
MEIKQTTSLKLSPIQQMEQTFYGIFSKFQLKIGTLITLGYKVQENNKEKIQYYEGIVISINNRGLNKAFTIFQTLHGINVERIFLLNSPNIISIVEKQQYKIRRAKLYYIRTIRKKRRQLKRLQ